jgi:hypothetical protein
MRLQSTITACRQPSPFFSKKIRIIFNFGRYRAKMVEITELKRWQIQRPVPGGAVVYQGIALKGGVPDGH